MLEKINEVLGLENIPQEKLRKKVNRPTWDHIFLLEALLWSQRSHDPQTQCGCVLVKHNTILSTGYNGFISEVDDDSLPNLRPYKYDFMIHSEANAIYNCASNGISTKWATAYVTGEPCNNCWQIMWQAKIKRVVYSDFNNPHMLQNDQASKVRNVLMMLFNGRLSVEFITSNDIDFTPIKNIYQKFVDKRVQVGV